MAEGDDYDPQAASIRLGPKPLPASPNAPAPGDPDFDPQAASARVGSKPVTQTSFNQVPSKEHGEGSLWGDFTHNIGLGTRNVIEGVTALPGQIADVATYPGRVINTALGIDRGTRPSEMIRGGLDATGLPVPQTPEEQRNAEAIRGASAMLTPMGLGALAPKLVASAPAIVRPFIGTNPTSALPAAGQVAAGGVGAVTGEELANSPIVPEWLKPSVRVAGNIIGAGGTSAVTSATGTLINAMRGVPNEVAAALKRLGIEPKTAGAVSPNPSVQQAEGGTIRLSGAVGTLKPAMQKTVDQFGNAVDETAAKLHPSVDTASSAGTVVQKELRDWKDNIMPAEQDAKWAPLNQRMAGSSVDPSSYRAALEYSASPPALASLPANQRAFASAQAKKWLDALNADAPPGQNLTWEQAHALKRQIGDAMGTPEIVDSLGGTNLRRIYGGLADGMEKTATQHGQGGVFADANASTIDAHQFLEGTVSKAIRTTNAAQEQIGPDVAARSLLEDNTAMQQLRDRVPKAADALGAYQLRQAAQAKPSQQGAGDTTSTGTFLSTMRGQQLRRPEGQAALYSDPEVAQRLKDLLTASGQLRGVEQNINKSGTAGAGQWWALGPEVLAAYYFGGPKAAAAMATSQFAVPWGVAKGLTSRPAIALSGAEQGAATPMRGRVAGLFGAQATMPPPDDQRP